MNNGSWVKTLLFTLIGFGLGWALCCLTCGRCSGGSCEREKAACHAEASCGHHTGKSKCCKADGAEGHEDHHHGEGSIADSTHSH